MILPHTRTHSTRETINEKGQRLPLRGTVDQISNDIKGIKDMGMGHVTFELNFRPIGRNIDIMIEKTKQPPKFVR